jgi:hypothetical protein
MSIQLQSPSINLPTTTYHDYHSKAARGPMLDRVYSMRYRSYFGAGHIDKCISGKFMDEYDGTANCQSHLLYNKNRAIASLRTCLFDPDKEGGVPTMK